MPHDRDQPVSGGQREEIQRLREEIDRQRQINAVLMDRVERSNEAVGSSLGLFHLASELSQQLERQQQSLRDAAKRADMANRAKSEFLANMSHEIRTPMTAILGYTDLLADPSLSEADRATHIATIKRNGEHLLSIINDILDLSKIEIGKMTVDEVPTSPAMIIEEIASLMRVRAYDQGIAFNVVYESPMPDSIDADPGRLRQILTNLVGNAIKFTETGGVTIRAGFDQDLPRLITIAVEDTGIGMRKDQLDRIFGAFTQADASTARKFGGSGLGLKISKSLAELMGWELSVDSTLGEGSTFTLRKRLPISAGDVRVIDLDQIAIMNREKSGEHADGSSPAMGSRENDCPLAGCTVLLAEDGVDNQRLISFHLRKAGATVVHATNGLHALREVTDRPQRPTSDTPEDAGSSQQPIDLILMDMQMPEMDGYTAASKLRGLGCDLPIIALTAHAMEGDREKCLESGCDDYLTKPINRDRLIGRCAYWADNRSGRTVENAPCEKDDRRTHATVTDGIDGQQGAVS